MRILFVTPSPPQPHARTAVPLVSWAQLHALRERHDVTVVTTAGPDPAEWRAVEQLRASGVDVHAQYRRDRHAAAGVARWVRNARRWLLTRRPMYILWYYEPGVQRTIRRLLATGEFDLVHVNDSAMACYDYPTAAPRLLVDNEIRAPRAANWSMGAGQGSYRRLLDEADWHRWRAYQCDAWNRFDRIEVFTERDARTLESVAPSVAPRVRVNPFGIETPPPADPSREEEGVVAFIGTFLHAPNVDAAQWLVREVMPRLRARHAGVRLRIIGSDPRGTLRGLSCDDVDVVGWVPAIEPEIERAAVIAAPVRIGGGQRMKVLQAIAMGKAVVTTPRGADGLLSDGGTPPVACGTTADEIADRIAFLLRDRDARQALCRRARVVAVEQHGVRAYGRRIEQTYAELTELRVSRLAREVGA